MERLTPLQKKELEIDSLRDKIYNAQQENDQLRTRYHGIEVDKTYRRILSEDKKAKDELIKELSNELSRRKLDNDSLSMDLAKRDLEIESYKERIVQLQGSLKDLLQKRDEVIDASYQRYQLEVADYRKVMDKISTSVPLSASRKAEIKEQAKPFQVMQSGSDTLAKELEPEKVLTASTDATDNESPYGEDLQRNSSSASRNGITRGIAKQFGRRGGAEARRKC